MSTLSNEPMFRLEQTQEETKLCHDVVYSFDTTGSMAPYIVEVKRDLHNRIREVFEKYEDVKVAIIAHGDYCDYEKTYMTKGIDFTRDVEALKDFIQNTPGTHGGDTPECYELVLREARTGLSWRKGSKKQLIMFGDSYPHAYEDYMEIMDRFPHVLEQIDWEETCLLVKEGVEITSIQSGKGSSDAADRFWVELGYKGRGWRLDSSKPGELLDLCMAALHRGQGRQCLQVFLEKLISSVSPEILGSIGDSLKRLLEEPGSTEALAPGQEYQYFTESLGVWKARFARQAAGRMKRNVVYQCNSIIPEKDVKVGLNILSKEENTWVYPGLYDGDIVEVHRQWTKKSVEQSKYLSDATRIKRLKHPNVSVVFGVLDPYSGGRNGLSTCLIMEPADNNLFNAAVKSIGGPRIPKQILLGYLCDAAKGLAYLHSLNVIHKSVCPSSIRMDKDVGKLCTASLVALNEDSIVQYKALELYYEGAEYTTYSDIWAMGITILEVLAGTQVYEELITHSSGGQIPKLLYNKTLPKELNYLSNERRDIVEKCLRWEPNERIKANSLTNELTSFLDAEETDVTSTDN